MEPKHSAKIFTSAQNIKLFSGCMTLSEYEIQIRDFNLVSRKVISFNSVLSFKNKFWVLLERASTISQPENTEPEFQNVLGAQESIPRNRFRQAGNLFLGSLKVYKFGLTIFPPPQKFISADIDESKLQIERFANTSFIISLYFLLVYKPNIFKG
jgi:hypothetical protein